MTESLFPIVFSISDAKKVFSDLHFSHLPIPVNAFTFGLNYPEWLLWSAPTLAQQIGSQKSDLYLRHWTLRQADDSSWANQSFFLWDLELEIENTSLGGDSLLTVDMEKNMMSHIPPYELRNKENWFVKSTGREGSRCSGRSKERGSFVGGKEKWWGERGEQIEREKEIDSGSFLIFCYIPELSSLSFKKHIYVLRIKFFLA